MLLRIRRRVAVATRLYGHDALVAIGLLALCVATYEWFGVGAAWFFFGCCCLSIGFALASTSRDTDEE